MSEVPPDRPDEGADRPVSMDKPGQSGTDPTELDFDPYRFGAPDHPIPPEYAPPGYKPPQPVQPAQPPAYPPPVQYPPASAYPPPAYQTGPPPPYARSYYARPPGRGKAITAMVLGIASIVLCFLSVLDIVLIALALIFGLIALAETSRTPTRDGRGMAIAGLICAAVGTVLAVVLTIWFVHAARHCSQYSSGTSQFQNCFRDHL